MFFELCNKAEEEGTWSSFQGVKDVILLHGLFYSLYIDRGTHYFHTPEAGGKVDITNPTQFGRAMHTLGIKLIPAYSPEARGRSERMFGTLQGRLPNVLTKEGIVQMSKANIFLKEKFIPQFNSRFQKKARNAQSGFIPWTKSERKLDDILCIQEQRTVGKDNTVSYKNALLQIPQDKGPAMSG